MDQLSRSSLEFDYSGSQAARSLKEEGIEVSLINSNPATIMTDPVVADNVYLKPLTVESIEDILKERQIDAVLLMGWQTLLIYALTLMRRVFGKNMVFGSLGLILTP